MDTALFRATAVQQCNDNGTRHQAHLGPSHHTQTHSGWCTFGTPIVHTHTHTGWCLLLRQVADKQFARAAYGVAGRLSSGETSRGSAPTVCSSPNSGAAFCQGTLLQPWALLWGLEVWLASGLNYFPALSHPAAAAASDPTSNKNVQLSKGEASQLWRHNRNQFASHWGFLLYFFNIQQLLW